MRQTFVKLSKDGEITHSISPFHSASPLQSQTTNKIGHNLHFEVIKTVAQYNESVQSRKLYYAIP